MIKIHDKLWFILQGNKNNTGTLAYMCQYEETEAGEASASTLTKQGTGRRWSHFTEKDGEDYLGEIVENKPLARMLYANVDIGQEIPPELYQAVAEILAMVYNMREK